MQSAKVFVNCKNYILLSKKKLHKYKYWDLKVLRLETQMVCSGWLKNDSVCLRFKRSSKCCVASRYNGLRLDIQRPDQENCLQPWEQQMPHASVWIPSWQCNSEEFLDQTSTNMKMMGNLIAASEQYWAILTTKELKLIFSPH